MSIPAEFPHEAKWIGLIDPPVAEQHENGNPALYLRRDFQLAKTAPARLLWAGLGLSVIFINGKRVGDAVLDCAFTDYNKSVLCAEEDVGDLLQVGENRIEVILGDGWYNQTTHDTWGFWQATWRGDRKLLLSLFIEESCVLCSDTDWLASREGVIVQSALRLGERHDYTKCIDWTAAEHAVELAAPAGKLKLCEMPPIRECEELDFVSCIDYGKGYLLDFGKNIAGYARITGTYPSGTTVKLRHGELLTDGRIDNTSNAQYISNADFEYQTDTYIFDGGEQIANPRFAYHGFQYVEVEGLPRKPRHGEIVGVSIHSDFARIGNFECSDGDLNRLYQMSIAAAEANFMGLPTDCPHREKNGWTGDAQLSVEQYLLNFDASANLTKWLEDIVEGQRENGAIPCIAPTGGWGYEWGSGPAWDFALFALPEAIARYRGGEDFSLETAKRYFEFMNARCEGNLNRVGLGDWCYPKQIKIDVAPTELTSSCYLMQMARLLAERTGEESYRKRAEEIRLAIADRYADATGMCALAALTYFGVVDRFDALLAELERCDYHYHAGILGVQYINRVLTERGRVDLFLRLLRSRGYPSFLHWADMGATTLWETYEGTYSRNHHMYSDIAAVMMRGVGGIRVMAPDCVEISPDAVDLTWFKVHTELRAGRVAVNYRDGIYRVEIPAGVCATFVKDGRRVALAPGRTEFSAKP